MSSVARLCVNGGVAPEEGDVNNVPLRGAPGRLILVGVPWVTSWFPSILLGYNMKSLSKLDYLVLYTKLYSCLWAHKLGQAGSTNRSAGLLVGRACLSEQRRPWSVETRGYPCLTSPQSTCRRSGEDEVTSMRSEDVASMKSHRVHGDQKKEILLSAYEGEHQVSGE
jgi:hypothetical protein